MAPFTRGRLKAGMNAGKRRDAMVCAAESEGLPHAGVDPHGTSAKCLECGGKLKRSVSYNREERNLWCQPCKTIRERDCNAPANILFRTVLGLVVAATGWDPKERASRRGRWPDRPYSRCWARQFNAPCRGGIIRR